MAKSPKHSADEKHTEKSDATVKKDSEKLAITKSSSASAKPAKEEKKVKKQHKVRKYLKDLKAEIKKVVWPGRKQVFKNTGIVLVFMTISAVFVWGLDTIFSQLLNLFLGA